MIHSNRVFLSLWDQIVTRIETSNHPLLGPVGSQRSTLGHDRDSGKCVLVRHCLSRPRFTRERECVNDLCACIDVLLCVCVYSVVADCPNRHQMAPNPAASNCYPQQLHVCHHHRSLCLSSSSFFLQMVSFFLLFHVPLSPSAMQMLVVHLSLHVVVCVGLKKKKKENSTELQSPFSASMISINYSYS